MRAMTVRPIDIGVLRCAEKPGFSQQIGRQGLFLMADAISRSRPTNRDGFRAAPMMRT